MFPVIDAVLCLLVVVSALVGLTRGFIREGLGVANWLIAIFVAISYHNNLDILLLEYISTNSIRTASSYAILFVSALIIGGLVIHLLAGLVKASGLSGTDKSIGMVFGLFRGALIAMVMTVLLDPIFNQQDWWSSSMLVPQFLVFESDIEAGISFCKELLANYLIAD